MVEGLWNSFKESQGDSMTRDIFDGNFWTATTIMIGLLTIVGGITIIVYLNLKVTTDALEAGYEECMIIRPSGNYNVVWRKECPGGVVNLYKE